MKPQICISTQKTNMNKRILIVDDEPFNILGMQLNINKLGINGLSGLYDRAYNGYEAILKVKDLYESTHQIYGLIFTDISMPIMDGYELTEEIRSYYRHIKVPQPMVVAVTGHVEEEFIKKAWMYEIDEVIPKPVNLENLKQIFTTMT